MRSLNDHIRFYLLIILIPTLLLISAVDYHQTNENIENDFHKQKMNSKESIEDTIELIDNRNTMLSDIFSKEMKNNSEPFLKAYNSSQNIADIDLHSVKDKMNWSMELDTVDLYVINSTGVIVNTTYKKDLGLDFKNYPDFYNKLQNVFKEGEFTSDLISAEIQTGKFRLFSYLPTPDGEYILEIGVYSHELNYWLSQRSYSETLNGLESINPFVEDIRIFHNNALLVTDPDKNISEDVEERCLKVYNDKNNITIFDDSNNLKKEYMLVHLPHEDYPSDASKVVEITYDNQLKAAELRQNLSFHILTGALSILVVTLTVFYLSKYLTKPIYDMIGDIDGITKGEQDKNIKLEKETNIEELKVLKDSTNNMLNKLRESIKELNESRKREQFLKSLLRQDTNNNLFVSTGFLQMIDEEELSEENRKYLEKAIKSNKRVMDLVDLEKEVNRATNDDIDYIDIKDVFKSVLKESKIFTDKSELNIDYRIEDGLNKIRGNYTLARIIITLIKTCVRRGRCSRIRLTAKNDKDMVKISIEDDGSKIPKKIKQKVSEGNYTGGSSGMGGAIYFMAKEILQIFDGELEIEDSELGGTRIDIYLEEK